MNAVGRIVVSAFVAACWAVGDAAQQGVLVKDGDAIAFLGDSITAHGDKPTGYVNLVMKGLEIAGVRDARKFAAGIGGDKSNGMLARVERDCLSKKPTFMTVSCGVNDVWHGTNGVPLEAYKKNMSGIFDKAAAANVKVMALTPTMITEDPGNPNNVKLKPYVDWLVGEAKRRGLLLADLNAEMHRKLDEMRSNAAVTGEKLPPHLLTWDGVHMIFPGNCMMAWSILRAFGVSESLKGDIESAWRKMAEPLSADKDQVDEAAAVFDGVKPSEMRGGMWKVVYSSAEGPQGRALETLTERLGPYFLREGHIATAMVLPLEKDGGEPVKGKRDIIVVGVPSENATLRGYLKDASVPDGGYLIRTFNEKGRNIVLVAGDSPETVLWATFDFLDVVAPALESKVSSQHGRYAGMFFRAEKIPECECRRQPQTPVRSIFSWGHVIDDCRETFRALARARFNRAILWNDQLVVNARDVVECAHSWGVKVFWGFSWGWTLSGKDAEGLDFGKLADEIVSDWRSRWKPMGGDGIYFQSFTETSKKNIGGRSIPEAVTELVNAVAKRIRAESPGTEIVFGLHSNSMKREGAAEAIAKVDPSLEILWENCGGFPFWETDGKVEPPDVAFCDQILALNPSVGLAWKAQLRMDWRNYVRPAGPFMLGCAGERLLARDRSVTVPRYASFDEDWILNGKMVYDFVRHIRAGGHAPREFNAVAEYNPPYGFATLCQAELFWSSEDSWDDIAKRARMRARPER